MPVTNDYQFRVRKDDSTKQMSPNFSASLSTIFEDVPEHGSYESLWSIFAPETSFQTSQLYLGEGFNQGPGIRYAADQKRLSV